MLMRGTLMFVVQHFAHICGIIDCLCLKSTCLPLSDDDAHYVVLQRFKLTTCFANILADLCESFDRADYCKITDCCKFCYAILRRACNFQSNQGLLYPSFLCVLSLISRFSCYSQVLPALLHLSRILEDHVLHGDDTI
jgi:hypothetical protein